MSFGPAASKSGTSRHETYSGVRLRSRLTSLTLPVSIFVFASDSVCAVSPVPRPSRSPATVSRFDAVTVLNPRARTRSFGGNANVIRIHPLTGTLSGV